LRSAIHAVVVSSVGLMVGTAYDLSDSALQTPAAWLVAGLSLATLLATTLDTVWVIAAAALLMLGLSAVV
jgi:chromate transport protein ChrA